jgi:subtilisin family serine protease
VDIISMSFAISKQDKQNKEAISQAIEAVQDKVLMFAAASNAGQNVGRTFPAKHNAVFCIHATNGNGSPLTLNPRPHLKDLNFSTLGQHVEAPSKGQETIRISGTSVATPVAAGIAALVLEFVRQPPVPKQQEIEHLEPSLKKKDGMEIVFTLMYNRFALEGGPKSYFYLMPWHLLGSEHARGNVEDARIRIAMDIKGALDSLGD